MVRTIRLCLGVVMVLALMPRTGLAQGSSAASITGVVRDASGGVLPGVTVEASSPALIEKVRTVVTNEQGQYRLLELRTGVYTVTVSLPGFSTFVREGLELPPNFTATVNVELKVGAVEETVTVSGRPPQVDVQNITQQKTISKDLLDAVPTGKSVLGYVALMPSAVSPTTAQDVGGSMGELWVRISVHGAKQNDQKLLQDGMAYNTLGNLGTGRTFFVNPLASQEIVIDVGSGGSAEYPLGGAVVNLIPKDGGNQVSGTAFMAGTNHSLQSDNLDGDLRDRGLTSVNGVRHIYDANVVVGGPLAKDRAWFMASARLWGRRARFANLYADADTTDWLFTPDLTRPGDAGEDFLAGSVRLTWQATARNKITASYDRQNNRSNVQGGSLASGARSLEAITNPDVYCNKPHLIQGTWNFVASPRLLFEAGGSTLLSYRDQFADICGGNVYAASVREQSTGLIYHGTGTRIISPAKQGNGRFSMSYVAGRHNVKAGMSLMRSFSAEGYTEYGAPGFPVNYTFRNGRPSSLTEYISPITDNTAIKADIGLFVQDQWTVKRVTLKAGLRYSYFNAHSYPIDAPAGLLGPVATTFEEATGLPSWHDLTPRMGVAWDVFGNGQTALKASLDRYVGGIGAGLANQFGAAGARVTSTTRSWTDSNGNFFPDCDLTSPAAQNLSASGGDVCGAMANSNFGNSVRSQEADPDWVKGWGNRDYNWSTSVSVDHQVSPGIALNAGYFRRWYGNQTVADNLLVTPADYDPFCITAPTDSRLGEVSGTTICGLYDINPTKFGQVYTQRTLAKNFGKASEIFNGVDANFAVRLPSKAVVGGGWSMGNTVNTTASEGIVGLGTNSKTKNCFVVDSPQALFHCESGNPYQHRFKVNGSVPLPLSFQLAVVYQSLPGPNYGAAYTVTSAAIAPSLGRPLAGGTSNVTIQLLPVNSAFIDERTNQLDIRMSKIFNLGTSKFQANLDVYNVFNGNNVLNVNSTYGTSWLTPTQILDARLVKFSVQVDF